MIIFAIKSFTFLQQKFMISGQKVAITQNYTFYNKVVILSENLTVLKVFIFYLKKKFIWDKKVKFINLQEKVFMKKIARKICDFKTKVWILWWKVAILQNSAFNNKHWWLKDKKLKKGQNTRP